MRLFVAVDPSAEAIRHLAEAARGLRVGPVRPEQWHVTLAFLGEVDDARLPAVRGAVAGAAAVARPGRLRIAGGGRFGNAVLWAGLAGDVDALTELAAAVRASLQPAGFPGDDRPYRPHLTLARLGRRTAGEYLRADVATLSGYRGPEWPLDQVRLVRSWLGGSARHETLASWPLGRVARR
jgi:2'-5' RNA ligase